MKIHFLGWILEKSQYILILIFFDAHFCYQNWSESPIFLLFRGRSASIFLFFLIKKHVVMQTYTRGFTYGHDVDNIHVRNNIGHWCCCLCPCAQIFFTCLFHALYFGILSRKWPKNNKKKKNYQNCDKWLKMLPSNCFDSFVFYWNTRSKSLVRNHWKSLWKIRNLVRQIRQIWQIK